MAEIPTKPYLLRAIHSWCEDSGYRPYIAVVADERTQVPREFVRNGEIVLNVSAQATHRLRIGNELIEFEARFSGTVRSVSIPIENVSAIYAQETGHGMAFDVVRTPATHAAASALAPAPTDPAPGSAAASAPSAAGVSEEGASALPSASPPAAPSAGAARRIGARPKLVPKPQSASGAATVAPEGPNNKANLTVAGQASQALDSGEASPAPADGPARKPARGGRRRSAAQAGTPEPSSGSGGAEIVPIGPAAGSPEQPPEPPSPGAGPGATPANGRAGRGHLKRVK